MLPSQRLCGVGVLDLATMSTFIMQATLQILPGIRLVIVNSVQVEECKPLQLRIRCPRGQSKLSVLICCMVLALRVQLAARLVATMTRTTW